MIYNIENFLKADFRIRYSSIEEFTALISFFQFKKVKYLRTNFTKDILIDVASRNIRSAYYLIYKDNGLYFSPYIDRSVLHEISVKDFIKSNAIQKLKNKVRVIDFGV